MKDFRNDLCNQFEIDLSLLEHNRVDGDWESFLSDKWPEMDIVYENRMYIIDDMPKRVTIEGRYSQLETFYTYDDAYGFNAEYFEKEKTFLSICSKMYACSSVYVESDILFANPFHFPEQCLDREFLLKLKSLFSEKGLVKIDDWEVLKCLFTLGLRDFVSTCLYLVDIKVILWVKGTCAVVYICNQEQEDFVRMICVTEGLYLRKKRTYDSKNH